MTAPWVLSLQRDHHAQWIVAELLKVGGFYCTPTDEMGRWLGPLVGYAGTYPPGMHFVGGTYADLALLEMYSIQSVRQSASRWSDKHHLSGDLPPFDTFVSVPSGGNVFGAFLAYECDRRYAALQKLVTTASKDGKRSESEFVLDRHELGRGARVILVEDIINNRSSAGKARALVEQAGAVVVGYAAMWSRAEGPAPDGLPTFALVDIPLPQWRQNERPDVAAMVDAGRIVWKPRARREELARIMQKHPLQL